MEQVSTHARRIDSGDSDSDCSNSVHSDPKENVVDELPNEIIAGQQVAVDNIGVRMSHPFLQNGYDWEKLVTTARSDSVTTVDPQYLPHNGPVLEKHVVARCKYLSLELTHENKEKVRDFLELHQNRMKQILKVWFHTFWVEQCKHLEITFDSGCDVTNLQEFQIAIQECKSLVNAKKIFMCLYLSFDYCGNFRKKIAKALMKQFGIRLDETTRPSEDIIDCGKRKPRKKKNCIEKLVSQILTNERKNLNKLAENTCGVCFTIIRPGQFLNDENDRKFRQPRRYYTWMINGDFVSTFGMFPNFLNNFHVVSYRIIVFTLSCIFRQNLNYDPKKKKRRYRRNMGSHKYPLERVPSTSNEGNGIDKLKSGAGDNISQQMKILQEKMKILEQMEAIALVTAEVSKDDPIAEDDFSNDTESVEVENAAVIKRKACVAPATLKSLSSWVSCKQKRVKKRKPDDESWEAGVGKQNVRKQRSNSISSNSTTSSTDIEEHNKVRVGKAKVTRTKETVKEHRRRLANELKNGRPDIICGKNNCAKSQDIALNLVEKK